jgi:hypothetical protein
MAGRRSRATLILVGTLALAFVASASAASPDVAAMNLQATDVPGATLVSQRTVKEPGYAAAYLRTFRFATPAGS